MWGFHTGLAGDLYVVKLFHGGLGPKEHAVKSNGLPPRLGNQGVN